MDCDSGDVVVALSPTNLSPKLPNFRDCCSLQRERDMELQLAKKLLEKEKSDEKTKMIEELPNKFIEPLVMAGLRVDLVEPGRVVCSMKVPPRLLNTGDFLHGGATATLVDLIGSSVIFTTGAPASGVSVEINISYMDAAYLDEEIEIEGKALRVGKAIAVVSVELRKKKTGKLIAQGRHTKYLALSSKI